MANDVIILGGLIITPLIKAQAALNVALEAEKTDLHRDAAIQRFEFTFELVWKTLKRVLKYKGLQVNNPRDVFRESAKQGLIDDVSMWFVFLEYRNQTVHVYDAEIAEEIYAGLPAFFKASQQLANLLKKL